MPGTSAKTAELKDYGPVEEASAELGGYTVGFARFKIDLDAGPMLKGLPDDRCQCPHWGYVTKGSVSFSFPDHVEVFEAGDAFYVPAGHGNAVESGSEVIMFSPTEELAVTEAAITRNMQAMQPS